MEQRYCLKTTIILLLSLSVFEALGKEPLICPILIAVPKDVFEKNLLVNQLEIFKHIFNYDKSFKTGEHELVNVIYSSDANHFQMERFTVEGLKDHQVKITAEDIKVRYALALSNRKTENFEITYDQISLQIKIHQDQRSIFASLENVKASITQEVTDFALKLAISEKQLKNLLQSEIIRRFRDIEKWEPYQWVIKTPYAPLIQGQFFQAFFKILGLPHFSKDRLIWCLTLDKGQVQDIDEVEIQQKLGRALDSSYFQFLIDQDDFNKGLRQLHQSDRQFLIPIPKDHESPYLHKDGTVINEAISPHIGMVIESIRDKFSPFKNAHSFDLSFFFSEEKFDEYWDSDEYQKSSLKIEKDGNMTFFQNLGITVNIYDKSGKLDRQLTVLVKINLKFQIYDPKRYNNAIPERKHRWQAKLHNIFVPSISIYDEDQNLMNMESMMALVGINLEAQKVVENFMDYYMSLNQFYFFNGIQGDYNMENHKDAYGLNFARTYTDYEEKKFFGFFFKYVLEPFLIDPQRYEDNSFFYFKRDHCNAMILREWRDLLYPYQNSPQRTFIDDYRYANLISADTCIKYYNVFGYPTSPDYNSLPERLRYELPIEKGHKTGYHYIEAPDGHLYRLHYLVAMGLNISIAIIGSIYLRACKLSKTQSDEIKKKKQR